MAYPSTPWPKRMAILSDYCAGTSIADIARQHEVTSRTVSQFAKQHGLSRPRGRPSKFPECPPDQRKRYQLLRQAHGADLAREIINLDEVKA